MLLLRSWDECLAGKTEGKTALMRASQLKVIEGISLVFLAASVASIQNVPTMNVLKLPLNLTADYQSGEGWKVEPAGEGFTSGFGPRRPLRSIHVRVLISKLTRGVLTTSLICRTLHALIMQLTDLLNMISLACRSRSALLSRLNDKTTVFMIK